MQASRRRPSALTFAVGTPLDEIELRVIRETLRHTKGDKSLAAQLLGISTRTIYRKLGECRRARISGTGARDAPATTVCHFVAAATPSSGSSVRMAMSAALGCLKSLGNPVAQGWHGARLWRLGLHGFRHSTQTLLRGGGPRAAGACCLFSGLGDYAAGRSRRSSPDEKALVGNSAAAPRSPAPATLSRGR